MAHRRRATQAKNRTRGSGTAPEARRTCAQAGERMPDTFTITQLAEEFSITPRAIRFYEDQHLIKPAREGMNRVYSYRDRARLKLILRGKRLGFSLAEIKEFLDLYEADRTQVEQLRQLRSAVTERMEQLQGQLSDLMVTLDELRDIEAQVLAALAVKGVDAAG